MCVDHQSDLIPYFVLSLVYATQYRTVLYAIQYKDPAVRVVVHCVGGRPRCKGVYACGVFFGYLS